MENELCNELIQRVYERGDNYSSYITAVDEKQYCYTKLFCEQAGVQYLKKLTTEIVGSQIEVGHSHEMMGILEGILNMFTQA